jgi:hypothetical protein
MLRQARCENELREALRTDREAFIREYRIIMHLHGDPADSDHATDEEMIRTLCEDQSMDEAFKARREAWEKSL